MNIPFDMFLQMMNGSQKAWNRTSKGGCVVGMHIDASGLYRIEFENGSSQAFVNDESFVCEAEVGPDGKPYRLWVEGKVFVTDTNPKHLGGGLRCKQEVRFICKLVSLDSEGYRQEEMDKQIRAEEEERRQEDMRLRAEEEEELWRRQQIENSELIAKERSDRLKKIGLAIGAVSVTETQGKIQFLMPTGAVLCLEAERWDYEEPITSISVGATRVDLI